MNTAKKLLVAAASVAMAVGFSSRTFAATTTAKYVVIDLSNGTGATSYPVSYLDAVPAGGWTDEHKTTKLVLRRIEAGTSKYEVQEPFYIGVFEVTQKQWELVMGDRPSEYKGNMRPVETISYNDIRGGSVGSFWPVSSAVNSTSFIGRLRAKSGLDNLDLPTEGQWEYACRAGTTSLYNNGGDTEEDLMTLGRYDGNKNDGRGGYNGKHTAVGSYEPNAWGLYDMHGNVWEWCLDWFAILFWNGRQDPKGPTYEEAAADDVAYKEDADVERVMRGGSWQNEAYFEERDLYLLSSTLRWHKVPTLRADYAGFRLAMNLTSFEGVGGGLEAQHDGRTWGCVVNVGKDGNETLTVVEVSPADGDLVIPPTLNGMPVAAIADNAFDDCKGLRSVVLPDSVTDIGDFAFCDTGVTNVVIGSGVKYVGDSAFEGCAKLKSVTLATGVEIIGESAFEDCRSLAEVVIPSTVTEICESAFEGCRALKKVVFEGDAPSAVGEDAFPSSAVINVRPDSTGWGVAIPGKWNGCRIVSSDDADPVDDVVDGAVSWDVKSVRTSFERTLWANDPADHFRIAGKDGLLYSFAIEASAGDAVFSIVDAKGDAVSDAATSISRLALPASGSPYILAVTHGTDAKAGGRYVIAGASANVGSVKLAKTAVSVKESAAYVEIAVNRTGKDGRVRVRYATADGTAEAGDDYVATSGVLEWANGDKKAKKVRIPLIPELVAHYVGNRSFTVTFTPMAAEEMAEGEYPAVIAGGDVCTVTITETSKKDVTEASVYAKQLPKRATLKADEDVPLSSGTFYGVIGEVVDEDGNGTLTNCLPKLAAVTFTASTAATPALSAKVAIAGKTYSFSAKGFGEMSDGGEVWRTNTLVNVQKSGKVAYTNTLAVYVRDGKTTDEGAWLTAMAWVDLTMNVPDAKGKGMQEGIRYAGNLYRQNDKIQAYLDAAVDFAGYYTVSLKSDESIGNGYLTLTVDNKGGVKVAGMLADGATKPSVSPKACAIIPDEASVNGCAMLVPVHFAKGTACLGGMLRLRAANAETPEGSESRIVVDSSNMFRWYDDSAMGCVALYGEDGYISLTPCGGWYDKVINLQRHYLGRALSVETADIEAFPMGELPEGYDYVAGISPNGFALALENDKVVYDKRKIVKTNRLTDFDLSVNPCNVSVKLARATGLVTGGFSLWAATDDGAKQKEVTGFKTYGVLLLACDPDAPIGESVIAPGFATKKVKTTYLDEKGKKKTVTWPFSAPFDVVGR